MKTAVIHCSSQIPWQRKRSAYFAEGFRTRGIACRVTDSRERLDEGFPVLLGTTLWKGIERDGGDFLLVDRCSFGDTEKFVSLVWNGHGRRGDHRVPENFNGERWERHGVAMKPWRRGERVVLCGQTAPYSPHWASLADWYASVKATHFRPHPAGDNPTGLPIALDFENAFAVTLNSSVGVQAVLDGVPTVATDEGSMAWDVTGRSTDVRTLMDREPWAHWLAWTQWSDDEIRAGVPWDYLLS